MKNCLSFSDKGLNEQGYIQLGDFNLFIGSNNAGKSNVLRLVEIISYILVSVSQGNEALENMQISFEGQPEDWVFAQNLNSKIYFSFSVEVEEADKDILNITPYVHSDKNPVLLMLGHKENWPKALKVTGFIEYFGKSPRAAITKVEIPNDHQAYSKEPLLFDKNSRKILSLRPDRLLEEEVWQIAGSYREENQWHNDYSLVGSAVHQFLRKLYDNLFKDLLIYIPAIREIKGISDEVSEKLANLKEGRKDERKMFDTVQQFLGTLIFANEEQGIELRFPGTSANKRVEIAAGNLVLPLSHYGSSVAQLLSLAAKIVLQGTNKVILIEEPEAHFHPGLQRKLVAFLKDNQGIFGHQYLIATHSSIFINEFINMGANVYSVYSKQDEEAVSKYSQVVSFSKEESLDIFRQLGIKASDLLFANGILIVEGLTDKAVYSDWAKKIGKDFKNAEIEVIDVEGAGNISKYLGSQVIKQSCFGCYGLVDKNAEKEVRQKLKDIVPDENIFTLVKGDLEDYYPRQLVLQFAREWAQYRGKKQEEIPSEIKEGETVKKLDKLLGKNTGWKKRLADKVVEEMASEQINEEIIDKLTQIHDAFY